MRKLNRYGLLVLVVGLTILVLMLAQGCKGDKPEPGLDATYTDTSAVVARTTTP